MPRSAPAQRGHTIRTAWWVAAVVALAGPARVFAARQTITTTYTHNADGALTAVTTQVGGQSATTYLTWDNFAPNPVSPATGTVSAGDGNLLGIGTSPAGTPQFEYDARDRLTGCTPAGDVTARYSYDPTSRMASSTLASGDVLQFYYDNARAAVMINTRQPSTATLASFLGPVRYLSDGTEQVLLTQRKDVAATYDFTAQVLSPYSYDPYGTATPGTGGSATTTYALADNPFRYAGEYQDPTCRAYYLRARWYLPELETFLSRDPADAMHRYGYTAGNPIGRVDPSGLAYEGFSRSVNHFLRPINHGVLGLTLPLIPIYGEFVGAVTLSANLPEFWHHPSTLTWVNYGLLLGSVAVEGAGEHPYFDSRFGGATAFRGRIGADALLGAAQSVLAGDRGHAKWGADAMVRSAEYSFSSIVSARLVEGIGYRPYSETTADVGKRAATYFAGDAHAGDMLVFRVRQSDGALLMRGTSPLREWRTIGGYHESVVAVAADWSMATEISVEDRGNFLSAKALTRWHERTDASPLPYMRGKQMLFVGSYSTDDVERAFDVSGEAQNPLSAYNHDPHGSHATVVYKFNHFTNNCHDYAKRVLANLGQ
jgi:RHS repeat-associated protein